MQCKQKRGIGSILPEIYNNYTTICQHQMNVLTAYKSTTSDKECTILQHLYTILTVISPKKQ